ncbi:hypothetical protein AALB39_26060 [Lachnospiraceae bacterium 54-53]
MADYISELYPIALDCGLSPERFWEFSPAEIQDILESHERKERRQMKQRLIEKHFLAKDIAQYVSCVINGSKDTKIMELWDYFPELFEGEGTDIEKKRQEQEQAAYKAQMIDFAYRHNHARSGGGKAGRHDAGKAPGNH